MAYKKLIQKILILSMTFVVLLNGTWLSGLAMGTSVVLAETEEGEEEVEEDESDGDDTDEEGSDEEEADGDTRDFTNDLRSSEANIYNMDLGQKSDAKRELLDKALDYDIRAQYEVTYAFLADKFGVTESNSHYNGLYYGDEGESSFDFNLNTSPEKAVNEYETGGEDVTLHDREELGNTTENDEEIDELTESIAAHFGPELTTTMSAYLSPHEPRKFSEDSVNGELGNGGAVGIGTYFNLNPGNGQRAFRAEGVEGVPIEKGMVDVVGTHLVDLLKYDHTDLYTKKQFENHMKKGIAYEDIEDLAKKYRSQIYKVEGTEVNDYITGESHIAQIDWAKAKDKKMQVRIKTDLSFLPEYAKYAARNQADGMTEEKVKDAITKGIGTHAAIQVQEDDKLQEKLDKYEELMEPRQAELDNIEAGSDTAILGWVPLYVDFDMKEITEENIFGADTSVDTLNEFLGKLDGSKYTQEGRIEAKGGEERTLGMKDLFYSKEASPLITLNTEETGNGYASVKAGKTNKPSTGTSIGKYAGIATLVEENWVKLAVNFVKDTFQENHISAYAPKDVDSYNVQVFRTLAAQPGEFDMDIDPAEEGALGLDTYGNIVNGKTGTILIPYWQNEVMGTLGIAGDDGEWVSHPAYADEKAIKVLGSDILDGVSKIKENEVKLEDVEKAFGEYFDKDIDEDFFSGVDMQGDIEGIKRYHDKDSESDPIHELAVAIVAGTHEQVKDFNENVKEWGANDKVMHIGTGVGEYGSDDGGISGNKADQDEYSNADLRERIMHILDYGFWDLIDLSLKSMIVSIYNAGWLNSGLSHVFHTDKITDTAIWDDVIKSVGLWIVGLAGVYIVFMAFRVFRREMKLGQFIKNFLVFALILLIPTVIYSPLIDLLINKPTPVIVGKQMQQMAILDFSRHIKDTDDDKDASYGLLFGGNLEIRKGDQDYLIEFYTTQHKNGYDITAPDAAGDLSIGDQVRSNKAQQTGKWNKKDVTKVSVSMFDLFEWAAERVDNQKDGNTTDDDLFKWLSDDSNDLVGEYEDISNYEEYFYDPEKYVENLNMDIKDSSGEKLEEVTASELFIKMYATSSSEDNTGRDLQKRIGELASIAQVAKENDPNEPVAMEEVEALIRDLSLTTSGRESAFGERESADVINPVPTVPGGDVPPVSVKTERLWDRVGSGQLTIPDTDYLNMQTIIDEVKPETKDPRDTPNERHVYNINEKVLNDYVNIHHVIRSSVGEGDRDIKQSEFGMVKLNQFFRTNSELDLPMFPTEIQPSTYSLDTYTRMAYIPVAEYKDSETEGIENVAEYITLRDNSVLALFFIGALLLLLAWGYVYYAVFGFIMVILTTVAFVWNYVIKAETNSDSPAWLGSIIVIVTFAVAKLGLLLLWFAMFYFLNMSFDNSGGETYPYMLVHSLALIIYILLMFIFVFKKVLMNIIKDPINMGGEELTGGVTNFLERLKGEGAERKKGADGQGEGGSGGKSVDKKLNSEGAGGEVNERGITAGIRNAAAVVSGTAVGGVQSLATVASGKVKPESTKYSGHENGISGYMKNGVMSEFEGIESESGQSGLSQSTLSSVSAGGVVGQVLSSTADGETISTMDLGSEESAQKMVAYLTSQGYKARAMGDGQVEFNSTGKDLEDSSVRKNLFGGFVDSLHGDLDGMEKVTVEQEDESGNYTWNKDGVVTIPVGDKGLTSMGLDTIINSKEFADNFIVEGMPSKGENGEYVAGSIDVTPKSGVNVDEVMENIYNQDTHHRDFIGDNKRGKTNLNTSLNLADIQDKEEVYDMLADGMSIKDDKVMYNSSNIKHVQSAAQIRGDINTEYKENFKETRSLRDKVMAYTVKGKNEGVGLSSRNSVTNEEDEMSLRRDGILSDDVETQLYAGENAEKVSKNVETFKNLGQLSKEDHKGYYEGVDELHRQGEELFTRGDGADKYDKALDKLAKAGASVGGNEEMITGVMSKYEKLGEERNKANILPEDYEAEVEGLFNELQLELQDEGVYTNAVTSEMSKGKDVSKEDKAALDKYAKEKKKIAEKGVSPDMLEKMGGDDYGKVMDLVKDIDKVTETGDGTLKVNSDSALDADDAARLVASMSKDYE